MQRSDLLRELRTGKLSKYERAATHCYLAVHVQALRHPSDAVAELEEELNLRLPSGDPVDRLAPIADPVERRAAYGEIAAAEERLETLRHERRQARREAVGRVGAESVAGFHAACHPVPPEATCRAFDAS